LFTDYNELALKCGYNLLAQCLDTGYNSRMTITVIGASGFLGKNTIRHLLSTTDYTIRAFCRSAQSLDFETENVERLELIAGDALDQADLRRALDGADVAIYLVHMMGNKSGDFYDLEAIAAAEMASAAEFCKVGRIIFMGGLGNDAEKLSKHLVSRHNTGIILREHGNLVIEFRAAMIIGTGSVAYDIVRTIAHRLPVLMVPSWAVTQTQPIALTDALQYIAAAITLEVTTSHTIQIGGPRRMTYEDLVQLYGRSIGRRPRVYVLSFVPHWLASAWINLFMPKKHSGVALPMVESLNNAMVVTDSSAHEFFPNIHPRPIETIFKDA
jgi:uncharacterized protein YbjT (DUF2867 family)